MVTETAAPLEVRSLKKVYGDLTAVNDVSFSVRRKEIVGLVGPNGAGKTTTINMILGILEPTTGSICIEGAELLQLFQWTTSEQSEELKRDKERIQRIKEELSDVIVYCLSMANAIDIDISNSVLEKLVNCIVKKLDIELANAHAETLIAKTTKKVSHL